MISKPKLGTRVRIQGLQGRADLNGRIGRVIKTLDKDARIGVAVQVINLIADEKPEKVKIKPMNIVEAPLESEIPETFLDGFDVVDSGDVVLGRISIASRDYRVGDLVLVEPPLLVFDPSYGYGGMFSAYMECSHSQRQQVMDFFSPPFEGDGFNKPQQKHQLRQRLATLQHALRQFVSSRPGAEKDLPLETAKKLLRIVDVNSHSFSRVSTGALVAKNCPPSSETALFWRGSKVEHSCAPNLSFATVQGKLIYRATRNISKGDRISISYQSSTLEHPQDQRREFLRENKAFTCACTRCTGPDECRPYYTKCWICKNPKAIVVWYQADSLYKCVSCQSATMPLDPKKQKEIEANFEQRLKMCEYSVRSGQAMYEGDHWFKIMVQLQKDMAKELPSLHWLHVSALRVMGSCAASFALMGLQNGHRGSSSAVQPYLYSSTLAQLQQAYWVQCISEIAYGTTPLKDVMTNAQAPKLVINPKKADLLEMVELLKQQRDRSESMEGGAVHPIFHAGQDWLLAGDPKHVADLYGQFLPLLQYWDRLSEENRANIGILVHSNGAENPFPNHLL